MGLPSDAAVIAHTLAWDLLIMGWEGSVGLMSRFFVTLISLAALAATSPQSAVAKPLQLFDINPNSCKSAIRKWEAKLGIPPHLLEAVSLAESGRWDAKGKESFAWPWTVTSGGKGTFYDTKREAILAVRALRSEKVSNIDVGCMQINMHYHPDAFKALDEAFDPLHNVEYAARFLAKLFTVKKSWPEAAAAYHSTTPEHNHAYKIKVIALWNDVRKSGASASRSPARYVRTANVTVPSSSVPAQIDHVRSNDFNQRLRDSRAAARALDRAARELEERASIRARQLSAWRERETSKLDLVHLSTMRRAELALRRKQLSTGDQSPPQFEDRRRRQLDSWRAHNAWVGGGANVERPAVSRAAYR